MFELPKVWPNRRWAEHPNFFRVILRGQRREHIILLCCMHKSFLCKRNIPIYIKEIVSALVKACMHQVISKNGLGFLISDLLYVNHTLFFFSSWLNRFFGAWSAIHFLVMLCTLKWKIPIGKKREKLKCPDGNTQNKPPLQVTSLYISSPLSPHHG